MSFSTGYRGVRNGSVQSTYQDQPGVAYNGMLAFASDLANCDAIFIGETDGIRAGAGVRFLASLDASVAPIQRPPVQAFLPEGDEAANEFAGIVVFDEAMQSDENGVPGWANGRTARILRPGRAGGRIYVVVKDAIVVGTSTVNWVTSPDAAAKYARGDFCPTALGGGAAGTSVALTNCSWVLGADAFGLAMLELHGNVIPIVSTDDSSL
jgi:hypothetical protein